MQNAPLVRAAGLEFGYRFSRGGLNSTLSLWQLHLNSELVFEGDDGVTSAGGPTVRRGIEFANFYQLLPRSPWLTLDADIALSKARFLTDPGNLGTFVPESIDDVTAAGLPRIGRTTRRACVCAISVRACWIGPATRSRLRQ